MKITVLQPNFFPFKSYFDVVRDVDKVIFADDSFYNKKCWVDKTIIKRNGNKFVFKIPTITGTELDEPLTNLNILSKKLDQSLIDGISIEDGHCHLDLKFLENIKSSKDDSVSSILAKISKAFLQERV